MRQKIGKVSINSNVETFLKQFDQGLPEHIRAEVFTKIEYAVFVEFGTYKMEPRAMVRDSIPAIEAKLTDEWQALAFPPTEQSLIAMVQRVVEFALEEIRRNTPRKSGTLQDSWEKEDAHSV